MASTTGVVTAFIIGAAAGTGGTVAVQSATESAADVPFCYFDVPADAIVCRPKTEAEKQLVPVEASDPATAKVTVQ
jgi:hypothetical protein